MITPYDRFLLYLAATDQSLELLHNVHLYPVSEVFFQQIKDSLPKKRSAKRSAGAFLPKVTKTLSKSKLALADKLEITGLVLDSETRQRCFDTLSLGYQAEVLYMLISSMLDDDTIAEIFQNEFGVNFSTNDTAYIKKYFWDVENMGFTKFREFLFDGNSARYSMSWKYWLAYTLPSELTLLHLGLTQYVEFSTDQAVSVLFQQAYARALESLVQNKVLDFHRAAQIMLSAYELAKKGTLSIGELIEQLKQIKLKETQPPVVNISALQPGGFDETPQRQ